MFDPHSEISKINRTPAGKAIRLSSDCRAVLSKAMDIHRLTGGAWDPTVKPLVDLWGFGVVADAKTVPGSYAIARSLKKSGFHHMSLTQTTGGKWTMSAHVHGLCLDLGGIAKGYGVDAVARLLTDAGYNDYLVEIGGEIVGAGKNQDGQPWAIGIGCPDREGVGKKVCRIVSRRDRAIATSGKFRNLFVENGKTYSHIIDPRTGCPVRNRIDSASVIAPDCTLADGLATALMIMDIRSSLDLVTRLDGVECLLLEQDEVGFRDIESQYFHG